jgi:DNA-binding transcriptional ArsR family regulator
MTVRTRGPGSYKLDVGETGDPAVSLALCPQQSVLTLLGQAVTGQRLGAPGGALQSIRRALRPQSRFALPAVAVCFARRAVVLDCSAPISPRADVTVAEQADRLRQLPGHVLHDDLAAAFGTSNGGGQLPAACRAAADQPSRWFDSMACASLDTWAATAMRWKRARPLLAREARRVGTAVVRGQLDLLLNSLHPRIRYRAGVLHLIESCSYQPTPLGRRRLVLIPMISGRDSVLASFELPDVAFIGYPLLGHQGVHAGAAASAAQHEDALSLILGPLRAAALRALTRARSTSELAALLGCALSTASYHCDQLEAAGLVRRQRRAQSVQLSRTLRGIELIDLLS